MLIKKKNINEKHVQHNSFLTILKIQTSLRILKIVTTPTQPQLNSKVRFDMKITLYNPPPPHKLKVINFKGRFVKQQFQQQYEQ